MWSKHPLPGHVVDVAEPTGFPNRQFFEAGNRSPVFESPVGGIGKIVCYDVFSSWRSPWLFTLKHVDLLVAISGSPTFERPVFEPLVHAPAMENAPLVRRFAYCNVARMDAGIDDGGGSRIICPGDCATKVQALRSCARPHTMKTCLSAERSTMNSPSGSDRCSLTDETCGQEWVASSGKCSTRPLTEDTPTQ